MCTFLFILFVYLALSITQQPCTNSQDIIAYDIGDILYKVANNGSDDLYCRIRY